MLFTKVVKEIFKSMIISLNSVDPCSS